MLKFLRRRAHLTQKELATAVGYSTAQVCRFEQNRWQPDAATVGALFVPALDLREAPEYATRMLQLAAASGRSQPARHTHSVTLTRAVEEEVTETIEDLGALEDIPPLPEQHVPRPSALARLRAQLAVHRCLALIGMAGVGKTSLAAALAHEQTSPVFWLTLTPGVTAGAEAITRQLALFLFAHGQPHMEPILRERRDAPLAADQKISLIAAGLAHLDALLCFDEAQVIGDDETVKQILRHLIASTPARLLCVSRSEVSLPNVIAVRLDGLERDEAEALLKRLGAPLNTQLADRLWRKSAGSPMLIRLAIGQMRGQPEKFIAHLEIQPHVERYLLDTVLRNLPLYAARLAALLAVFRQPIDLLDDMLIEAIHAGEGEFDLRRAAAELQRRHLIEQVHEAALHPLVHDHFYSALAADPPRRKRLHRIAAEWSTARGDIVEATYHLFRSGRFKQAVDVIADQGNRLFSRGQGFVAVTLIEELLAHARLRDPQPDLLRRLLMTHGDLLASTVRAQEGEASLEQAVTLASQADPKVRAEIALALGRVWVRRGRMKEALELFETSMAALPADDVWLRARLLVSSMAPLVRLALLAEAEHTGEEALALADQLTPLSPQFADEQRSLIYYQLGIAKHRGQKREEALTCWRRSLDLARQTGLISIANAAQGNLGGLAFDLGQMDEALRQWQAATDGSLTIGDTHSASVFLANLAMIYRLRDEPDAALAKLDESAALAGRAGDTMWVANAENLRATVLLDQGRADEARKLVKDLIERTATYSDARLAMNLLDKLAMTQLACGQAASAQVTLYKALDTSMVKNDAEYRARLNTTLAVARLVEGDFEGAAMLITDPPPNSPVRITVERTLARAVLALARGEVDQAHRLARDVADQARRAGALIIARRAERLLQLSAPPPFVDLPKLLWM